MASQYLLVVNPSVPIDSVEELIAFGRSHLGGLTYASGGLGGPSDAASEPEITWTLVGKLRSLSSKLWQLRGKKWATEARREVPPVTGWRGSPRSRNSSSLLL